MCFVLRFTPAERGAGGWVDRSAGEDCVEDSRPRSPLRRCGPEWPLAVIRRWQVRRPARSILDFRREISLSPASAQGSTASSPSGLAAQRWGPGGLSPSEWGEEYARTTPGQPSAAFRASTRWALGRGFADEARRRAGPSGGGLLRPSSDSVANGRGRFGRHASARRSLARVGWPVGRPTLRPPLPFGADLAGRGRTGPIGRGRRGRLEVDPDRREGRSEAARPAGCGVGGPPWGVLDPGLVRPMTDVEAELGGQIGRRRLVSRLEALPGLRQERRRGESASRPPA